MQDYLPDESGSHRRLYDYFINCFKKGKSLDIPEGANKELAFQALQTDVMYRKAVLIFSLVTQKLHASALNRIILIKAT